MGIWDKVKAGISHELIDIIQWLDDSRDTMVYRFERYNNEIKNGAKLVVREGQVAAFIEEGKLADVFQPGTYTLTTQNLPILATLKGWKYGFESPFKSEVYFVSTRLFTDRKWGTKNPIMLRDSEFGMVRLRAFGNAAYKISDPAAFLRNVVGTDSRFTVDELGDQLRDMTVARFTDALGESKLAALDIAAHQDELGKTLIGKMADDFAGFGLQLASLTIENISLPPEVEAAMDKRTSMGVLGNLGAYTQFQAANALEAAAKNPNGGGVAGLGAQLAAGVGMGNVMAAGLSGASAQSGPPPVPGAIAPYFAAINGQQVGPFDGAALKGQIAGGQITRETLLWKQGMVNWTAASMVSDVAPLFASVPPPLPK